MAAPGTTLERLVGYLFDGAAADPLAVEMTAWLAAGPRFRAFTEAHRDKIRKKLRGAIEPDARLDVRTELRVARALLADRHFELAFEAYGSGRRGPDFSVGYRGERRFNLEVTRMHGDPAAAGYGMQLLAKLRQLPPGVPNALCVEIDAASELDAAATFAALRARADRKDETFFTERGFPGTRGFYDRYLRLGAVIVSRETAAGDARASLWANRAARSPVPASAIAACLRCLRDA